VISKCESGKKKKKIIEWIICGVSLLFLCSVVSYMFINEHLALTRVDSVLSEKIDDKIMSANIIFIPAYVNENQTRYGISASGVIFQKEGNTYYILTANHTLKAATGATYYILDYTQKAPNEEFPGYGLTEYFKQLPTARIEYQNDDYDIAILSFESEADLTPLEIATENAQSGDRIAVISSPEGYGRNMFTYGKVLKNSRVQVEGEKREVFSHTAFIYDGSSGSVVLNEDMKIVGINLASSEFPIFGKFRNSVAVPAERLRDIVEEITYSEE